MRMTRREFVGTLAAAGALGRRPGRQDATRAREYGLPVPARGLRGDSSVMAAARAGDLTPFIRRLPPDEPPDRLPRDPAGLPGAALRKSFRDLKRHFVFEYYAWYRTDPWFHWDEAGRTPPLDLATNYVPKLGPYDSRDRAALEQHARWIAESGAGAVNLSWWGPDSYSNGNVHLLMDVMRDHDVHVAFHLEPYRLDRAHLYAQDVMYLVREYGDRRGWDCFLVLEDASGGAGPVFKSFRTLLPPTATDCHGITSRVPDYVDDSVWAAQTARVRDELRHDFDHVTLLGDSLDVGRTRAAGLDGIAIYDNFVEPDTWVSHARNCEWKSLLFSFNANPGYDAIVLRDVPPDSCYRPAPFLPGVEDFDWFAARDRLRAQHLSAARLRASFRETLELQTSPAYPNARRGFLLVYLNSFNEWYEGHQIEPMKSYAELSDVERAMGYHNAPTGDYRLRTLTELLGAVLGSGDGE